MMPAEAAGTELQVTVEGVFKPNGICFHEVLYFRFGLSVKVAVNPALSYGFVICHIFVS